ncbi:MAG TPA: VOC family protein [Geminicoccus sp.]|uniref:VOC family protein n=1 Tax=Geminicoccus sp. TaxID=2024832 RepID=UPI002CAECE67|nr:VOC family protein [Geminicoccus sp.]HWL71050.1 VOC family protein [Geminicoccus sp.]
MLDHLSIRVADLARSRRMYDACLPALGYHAVVTIDDAPDFKGVGYGGDSHEPGFWIGASTDPADPPPVPIDGMHVAFGAKDRPSVDAWYRAALAHGGTDNGPPDIRAHYHPNYYAAYVIDPDGYHLEAVCHLAA